METIHRNEKQLKQLTATKNRSLTYVMFSLFRYNVQEISTLLYYGCAYMHLYIVGGS